MQYDHLTYSANSMIFPLGYKSNNTVYLLILTTSKWQPV